MAALRQLVQVDLSEDELAELGWRGLAPAVRLAGWLSSCVHGEGRSAADRQFYYINSRPCDPARISKVVNEVSQCRQAGTGSCTWGNKLGQVFEDCSKFISRIFCR